MLDGRKGDRPTANGKGISLAGQIASSISLEAETALYSEGGNSATHLPTEDIL